MARILDSVSRAEELRELSMLELDQLAVEIRELIIETVSRNGGHLAANLGVVELTLAILRTFTPPHDKILWDVSHQTYTYKILTGRKDRFQTIRKYGGISGFSSRNESACDCFGAGHSGTALSAALGMAVARDRLGGSEHVVAVVGDGSAGCGVTFEALNNVAGTTKRLIVILNDNEMSISANVGAMSAYFGRLLASPRYNRIKKKVEGFAERIGMGALRKTYFRLEEAAKGLLLRSVIFEEFGLRYIGPIDGHDIRALTDALTIAKESARPVILHVSTQKGRGYEFAEKHPERWHGAASFDVESGEAIVRASGPTYSEVFGTVLERLAAQDRRIVAITAAMKSATGLSGFAERMPDRFFDVGISEEHAVVFAAGLATQGFVPVFAVYSTFLQRSVDYVIHDVCLQNLPVVFCVDRAGVVGDDGPTHHGIFDVACLSCVPNLVIMQPKDEGELAGMLLAATKLGKPVIIRYPRGCGPGVEVPMWPVPPDIGRAEVVKDGRDVMIWALGDMVPVAVKTAAILGGSGVSAGVVNARFVRPLDVALLFEHVKSARLIATMENGVVRGGFGSSVEDVLLVARSSCRMLKFGWPDEFIPQGAQEILMEKYGLTADSVAAKIMAALV